MKQTCTAFSNFSQIGSGTLQEVATQLKMHLENYPEASVLVFDDRTSQPVEIDLRGSLETVQKRYEPSPEEPSKKGGPGRPKLGVHAREVTLLPQHWEWLSSQPGGASVTLRKLVDEAKKKNLGQDQVRQSRDATYRFMNAIAGNLPFYEEALRYLYAGDQPKFSHLILNWPADVKAHILTLSHSAFELEHKTKT